MRNFSARITDAAGGHGRTVHAVQSFRQDAGSRGFAGSARANEEISMRQTPFGNGVFQSTHDMVLAENVVEYLRSVFACENLVTHRSKIRCASAKQKHQCRENRSRRMGPISLMRPWGLMCCRSGPARRRNRWPPHRAKFLLLSSALCEDSFFNAAQTRLGACIYFGDLLLGGSHRTWSGQLHCWLQNRSREF